MAKKTIKLSQTLVLFKYILHQFGVTDIEPLVRDLKSSVLEQLDENNISHYYWELNKRMFPSAILTKEQLRIYDENIISHTQHINAKRSEPIQWRYFQYIGFAKEHLVQISPFERLLSPVTFSEHQLRIPAIVTPQVGRSTVTGKKTFERFDDTL